MVKAGKSGQLAVVAALLLSAVGCYLAWRSGCVFDSKQGIGNAQLGIVLSGWALASAAAACCAMVFSVFLFLRRPAAYLMVAALSVAILVAPLSILSLLVAESYGADSCSR
jgi:hypothetical protein